MPPKTQVTIDESGNIHIPKHIRKSLDLPLGTKLTIQADITNDTITLRPAHTPQPTAKKNITLVVLKNADGTEAKDFVKETREEREKTLLQRSGF